MPHRPEQIQEELHRRYRRMTQNVSLLDPQLPDDGALLLICLMEESCERIIEVLDRLEATLPPDQTPPESK